jgi:beta-phosphoglucomutase
MRRRIDALLFDLDGTLIDSMPLHERAWALWHERRGQSIDVRSFFKTTAGRTNAEVLAEVYPQLSEAERAAMGDEKEALYRELAAQALGLVTGADAFVSAARAAGLRLAVCTASTLQNLALAFAQHPIDRWVQTVVSPADRASWPSPGDDRPQGRSSSGFSPADRASWPSSADHAEKPETGNLLRGKPHPDLFLEAAHRLGVPAAHCLVFEDAPLGIEAARRAGMDAVALTTTLTADAFAAFSNLRAVANDFRGLDLADLTSETRHA